MDVSQIVLGQGNLTYYRWGNGQKVIIALHGYGEKATSFAGWGSSLPSGFTLFAPDLPHHEDSTWPDGKAFTTQDLHAFIQAMTGKNAPFILAGYSMGGRISLSYFQAYPDQIEHLVLIAPDGLKMNFWYWLATQTKSGNRLFHYTMIHPGWFLGIVGWLGRYKLVNTGIVKYVQRYLGNATNRTRLYKVWTCMHSFRPDLKLIRRQIKEKGLKTDLIFGHYDKIIQPTQGYRFIKTIEPYCHLKELPTGHLLLAPGSAELCLEVVTGLPVEARQPLSGEAGPEIHTS
jgi:pimeloyl-ACP methyl ester carboxylesterase